MAIPLCAMVRACSIDPRLAACPSLVSCLASCRRTHEKLYAYWNELARGVLTQPEQQEGEHISFAAAFKQLLDTKTEGAGRAVFNQNLAACAAFRIGHCHRHRDCFARACDASCCAGS